MPARIETNTLGSELITSNGMWDTVCEVYTIFQKYCNMQCHQRTFNQECLNYGIIPVGAKAFAMVKYQSSEGSSQGDSLAMGMYALGVID